MFQDIKMAIERFQHDVWPSAHLRFAHAETLVPFLSLLGIYSDQSLWNISRISPFAANVWIEVYLIQEKVSLEHVRIRFLHNETPVKLPVCAFEYCQYQELEHGYQDYFDCSFKKVCQ
jgi:hypothetical protein